MSTNHVKQRFFINDLTSRHSGRSLATLDRLKIFKSLGVDVSLSTFQFNLDLTEILTAQSVPLQDVNNLYLRLVLDLNNLQEFKDLYRTWHSNPVYSSKNQLLFEDLLDQYSHLLRRNYWTEAPDKSFYIFRTDYFNLFGELKLQQYFDTQLNMLTSRYWDGEVWRIFQTKAEQITYYINLLASKGQFILYFDSVDEHEQAIYNHPFINVIGRVNILHSVHLTTEHQILPGYRNMLTNHFPNTYFVSGTALQAAELTKIGILNSISIPPILGIGVSENETVSDSNLIVMVSRIDPIKRIEDAIRAVAIAHQTLSTLHFEIWGAISDDEYNNTLQNLIIESNATEYIHLVGAYTDATPILKRALLSLNTSTQEGFARTILESFSVGTRVLGYNVEYGPSELIKDNLTGLLVDNGDYTALAGAIVKGFNQFNNPNFRNNLRALTVKNFNFKVMATKWLNLIQNIEGKD